MVDQSGEAMPAPSDSGPLTQDVTELDTAVFCSADIQQAAAAHRLERSEMIRQAARREIGRAEATQQELWRIGRRLFALGMEYYPIFTTMEPTLDQIVHLNKLRRERALYYERIDELRRRYAAIMESARRLLLTAEKISRPLAEAMRRDTGA